MRRMILAALGALMTFSMMSCGSEEPGLEHDRYEVYSAFLEQRYVDDFGLGFMVLGSSTSSFLEEFPADLLPVSHGALREYEDRLDTPAELDVERISLSVPLEGLTEEEYAGLVVPNIGDCDLVAFEEAFPDAEGVVRVTNVGISRDGSEAILCASFTTQCFHGHGGCARLVRDPSEPEKWLVEYVGLLDA